MPSRHNKTRVEDIVRVDAKTLDTIKNRNGFTAETFNASICFVTFIKPNSAQILEFTFPVQIKELTSGAKAQMMAIVTSEGS